MDYSGDIRATLCHFNSNHDPNTGRFTSNETKTLAGKIHKEASSRVGRIEDDVKAAVARTSAKMYGLDHKQKTMESIERKIDTDSIEKGISKKQAAEDIKDAVRFTTVSGDKDFVSNYRELKYELGKKGYEEVRCKNYWRLYNDGKASHKQVTSVFGDDSGYRFEIQFQTPSSLKAKEEKTSLYEEARKPDTSASRKAELVSEMNRLADGVSDPVDIYDIKSH